MLIFVCLFVCVYSKYLVIEALTEFGHNDLGGGGLTVTFHLIFFHISFF